MYRIVFRKSAEKDMYKLPANVTKRISPVIDDLAKNPRPKGAKKLEVEDEDI